MKKILFLVIIITLPIIAYFQYANWKRFNPPSDYVYTTNDSIDINYYDEAAVKLYYESAYEIGSFAKRMWFNNNIDVLNPDESQEAIAATKYYNDLKALAKRLEMKLALSNSLKAKGYNNREVKFIFENGLTAASYEREQMMNQMTQLQFGDINKHVWRLQNKLVEKGYSTPIDGNFRIGTQETLRAFQADQNLFPSGILDEDTFDALF